MNGAQLRAMLWLRWRLTRNQWIRTSGVGAAIAMLFLLAGLCLAVAGSLAGVVGGAAGLSHASPGGNRLAWDILVAVFLFFWTSGLITELQRSDVLDLTRLLHLPVSVRDVFLLNYLASHLSFSLAMMLPAMLGLTAGLMWGQSWAAVLLLPLVLGFFFMITAWTYCLRGWLAALMVNKRRRRTIIVGITMTFILLSQLPNLLTNVWSNGQVYRAPRTPQQYEQFAERLAQEQAKKAVMLDVAHCAVPLLWLPLGAEALSEGRVWPAIFAAFGMFALGAWGLARGYRATLRFYLGERGKQRAAVPAAAKPSSARAAVTVARGRILLERRLPLVPEEVAAVALATFRSIARAPEVKMGLATNAIIFLVLGVSVLVRRSEAMPVGVHPLIASAAVAISFMGLSQLMSNHFGFDRNGFRSLVLQPAPRRYLLLGKNLALLPVAMGVFAIYLGFAAALAGLQIADVLAAGFEFTTAFLVMSVLGNLTSIVAPYRIAAGSLRASKTQGVTQLLRFVLALLTPMVLAIAFLPAALGLLSGQMGWLPTPPATVLCAALLAILAAALYWRTLAPLGRLLQRRERKILQSVTQEVE